MKANDLNFELAFLDYSRQDGSGEIGSETLDLNFVFHVERECPSLSRRSESASDTALCPGK
jgi:hypothetical protein